MQSAQAVQQVAQQTVGQASIFGIRLEGWLTIIAVILGPILAVQAQKYIERKREERLRKLFLFRELMATRGTRLSSRHVEALNLIDLEYDPRIDRQRKVHEAWRSYFDSLNLPNDPNNPQSLFEKRDNAFVELMYEMGNYLAFRFDRVAIQRNIYSPMAHGEIEDDLRLIRRGVVDLLTGKRALTTLSWLMPGQSPLQVTAVQPPPTTITVVPGPPKQQQPLDAGPVSKE